MNNLIKFISLFLIFTNIVVAEEVKVFDFTEKELKTLEVRKVRGAKSNTEYTLGSNDNGNYLKATADNAASGLGKEIKIDLNKTPYLNITWKIEKDLKGIDERSKKGMIMQHEYLLLKKQEPLPIK